MTVQAWFDKQTTWRAEVLALRALLLSLGLTETLKWRQPCYMAGGNNVAVMGTRKASVDLGLTQGVLLHDPDGVLVSAGPNSRAARVLRIASVGDITSREASIRAVLQDAIKHAEAGTKVNFARDRAAEPLPDEWLTIREQDPELGAAFDALTPGRRRGFLLHFNGAKRSATRTLRILESKERIMAGKGRLDCICGRSKRMPRCDGSHKYI